MYSTVHFKFHYACFTVANVFFSNKRRDESITLKFAKLTIFVRNRCNIVHQIACTFFSGDNIIGPRFGAGTQIRAPFPPKSWLRASHLRHIRSQNKHYTDLVFF